MYKRVTGIYAIRHKDRCYFGSAVCVKGRINMHKRELRNGEHSNSYLQHVFNKYSEEVSFEVVEECSRELLRVREQFYIDSFDGEILNLAKQVCELAPREEHSKRMKGAWAKRSLEQTVSMSKKISETLKKKYREQPEALEKARKALVKARASKACKQRKTSPEANEKRRIAAKKQWAARTEEQRKALAEKISKTYLESTTEQERAERGRIGGKACKGIPKTRKTA